MSSFDTRPPVTAGAAIGGTAVAAMLADTGRLCPVFAGAALIHGDQLRIRLGRNEARIRAPRDYLRRLFDWCDGERSLDDLAVCAQAAWGSGEFMYFVTDMLAAGVLVDAARFLSGAAAKTLGDQRLGRNVEREQWASLPSQLPEQLSPLALPLPMPPEGDLARLLGGRASAPAFADAELTGNALSALLHSAYGVVGRNPASPAKVRRSVPSGGGFYSCRIDVVVLRQIGDIPRGVYHVEYSANGAVGLRPVAGDLSLVPRAFRQPERLRHAAGVIVISADFARPALKYRNHVYPFALIEAGAMLQNAALAAAETGVGCRIMGGIEASRLAAVCGRDEDSILVSAIFGSLSSTQAEPLPPRLPVDFVWLDLLPDVNFHLGRGRVRGSESTHRPCWGRDPDPALAYDKAIAETFERHVYHSLRPTIHGCFNELSGAVDPRSIIAYRPGQYRRADFPFVPFEPQRQNAWIGAVEVGSGGAAWILADCVCDLPANPAGTPHAYTRATSSGWASHLDPEQAARRAFFELVERDAFMRHWLAQQPGVELDPDSLPPDIHKRVAALKARRADVSLQRLDRARYPVFMVMVQHHGTPFTVVGAAAGDDAEEVLDSALVEAETGAWTRLVAKGSRRLSAAQVATPLDHADLYAQRSVYRRADALIASTRRETFAAARVLFPSPDTALPELAAMAKLKIYRIDPVTPDAPLTLAGQPLHSVRIVAPGLIPITFGFRHLPLGMVNSSHRNALFPHPFP